MVHWRHVLIVTYAGKHTLTMVSITSTLETSWQWLGSAGPI